MNNIRIVLIEREKYFICHLLINALVGINIIKLTNIPLYYNRDSKTNSSSNSIIVLVITTLKSEKVSITIYLVNDEVIPPRVYFTILIVSVKLRLLP